MNRLYHLTLCLACCIGSFLSLCSHSFADNLDTPNVVLIIADDQVRGDLALAMPYTKKHLFKRGANFTRAYVTTPWCCPSRSTMFTGKLASVHGVKDNDIPLDSKTIFHDLQSNGYYTALIGKYLNSWDGSPRPEVDFWRGTSFGNVLWNSPTFFDDNGNALKKRIHVMKAIRGFTRGFFEQFDSQEKKNFFLVLSPPAPHRPAVPEKKYAHLFKDIAPYRPENFGCTHREGKPRWLQETPCPSKSVQKKFDAYRRNQLRSLKSMDDLVHLIVKELSARAILDKTMIVYISDNGMMRGDFGIYDKPYPYERAVHVPMAIRYPPLFTEGQQIHKLVVNADIPATIYELAGVTPPDEIYGRSLKGLRKGPWRTSIILEGFGKEDGGDRRRQSFVSLVEEQYQLLLHRNDIFEFYDLKADPLQLHNLSNLENPFIRKHAQEMFEEILAIRPDILSPGWLQESVLDVLHTGGENNSK